MREIRLVDWSGTRWGKREEQVGCFRVNGPGCENYLTFPNIKEAMGYARKQSRDYLRRSSVIGSRARREEDEKTIRVYGSKYVKTWRIIEE